MQALPSDVWVGIDWGDSAHAVCIINADGKIMASFDVKHAAAEVDEMVVKIKNAGNVLGVCLETNHGLMLLKLLESNITVYAINPKLSDQWRKACSVSESKSDSQDSFILARGVRLYHEQLRALLPDDPITRELQAFCRLEHKLIDERTAEVERLISALKEYHLEILPWFEKWACPSAWDFVKAFPTPADLRNATTAKLMGFLKTHHMRLTDKWHKQMDGHAAVPPWAEDPVTVHVQSHTALAAVSKLKAIQRSIGEAREHINELFAKHPDADLFDSLPGAGEKLCPRLLSIFGSRRERFERPEEVQEIAGVVPVTRSSGRTRIVKLRHACRKDFRHTLYLFAFTSISRCTWARVFYDKCKARGDRHSLALRKLGAKWVKIIHAMWRDRTAYNDQRYMAALARQGSPLAASPDP